MASAWSCTIHLLTIGTADASIYLVKMNVEGSLHLCSVMLLETKGKSSVCSTTGSSFDWNDHQIDSEPNTKHEFQTLVKLKMAMDILDF